MFHLFKLTMLILEVMELLRHNNGNGLHCTFVQPFSSGTMARLVMKYKNIPFILLIFVWQRDWLAWRASVDFTQKRTKYKFKVVQECRFLARPCSRHVRPFKTKEMADSRVSL